MALVLVNYNNPDCVIEMQPPSNALKTSQSIH